MRFSDFTKPHKLEIVKTMSCENLTVIFQKLQICLLRFCKKSEKSDRNAKCVQSHKVENSYFFDLQSSIIS